MSYGIRVWLRLLDSKTNPWTPSELAFLAKFGGNVHPSGLPHPISKRAYDFNEWRFESGCAPEDELETHVDALKAKTESIGRLLSDLAARPGAKCSLEVHVSCDAERGAPPVILQPRNIHFLQGIGADADIDITF